MEFCDLQFWDELNTHNRGVTGLYHCLPIILTDQRRTQVDTYSLKHSKQMAGSFCRDLCFSAKQLQKGHHSFLPDEIMPGLCLIFSFDLQLNIIFF